MKNKIELLQECRLQLEYLNDKFGETGSTNALLAKLNALLLEETSQTHVIHHSFFDKSLRYIADKAQILAKF